MAKATSIVYKDLREYIDAVDRLGELRRVDGADWDLEIGAITEVTARAAQPKVKCRKRLRDPPRASYLRLCSVNVSSSSPMPTTSGH